MVWQTGQKLNNGQYEIQRVLGQGRYCITYLAQEIKTGQFVVIKTLNDEALDTAIRAGELTTDDRKRFEDKFFDEADKLQQFQNHPHIVQRLGKFCEPSRNCIVLEYIPGDTLNRLVKRVLPEKEALVYIQQIGKALSAVHQKQWMHRDIKPDNIMVRAGKYEAVLIDFEKEIYQRLGRTR